MPAFAVCERMPISCGPSICEKTRASLRIHIATNKSMFGIREESPSRSATLRFASISSSDISLSSVTGGIGGSGAGRNDLNGFAYHMTSLMSFSYLLYCRKLKVKGKRSDILITIASQEVFLNNGKAINIFRWTIYTFHTMLFVSKSYFIYKSLKLGIYKYTICVYNSFTRINLRSKDEVEYAKIQVVP